MYGKSRRSHGVRFAVKPDGQVAKVMLAGDFSGWRSLPMRKQRNGTFVRIVPGLRGTFEYKFLLDGRWVKDPDTSRWSRNALGTFNSVGRIK